MIRILLFLLFSSFSVCSLAQQEISLWSDNKEAKAVCINNTKANCFILIDNVKVDISQAENMNLGKLGTTPRKAYSKVSSFPTEWLKSSNGEYMVVITTEAWFEGQLYTVSEPVLVKDQVFQPR